MLLNTLRFHDSYLRHDRILSPAKSREFATDSKRKITTSISEICVLPEAVMLYYYFVTNGMTMRVNVNVAKIVDVVALR